MAGKAKSAKRPDRRPARQRYWSSRALERNKVRRMVKASRGLRTRDPLTEEQALKIWKAAKKNTRALGRQARQITIEKKPKKVKEESYA